MLGSLFSLVFAAISLDGVSGGELRAIAGFDANNVHVGDPMTLTVDFVGQADFASLHPPELSREVDRKTWKVDDVSAKTETYRNARRLTYRVRPVREGVLEFPALTFSYMSALSNAPALVSTSPVLVHAKPGAQVALAELEYGRTNLPLPDGLVLNLKGSQWGTVLSEDELFAWRKACANPSAEAFAAFGFPEARLNEAACELIAGNWARASRIYSLLEWRIGQTPTVERGIVAALALKTGDPNAELPMWRQVLRPVLRFAWPGRILSIVGAVLALALLLVLLRKAVRILACAAVVFVAAGAFAADPFEEMDKHIQMMQRQMRQHMEEMTMMMGGGGMSLSINGRPAPKVEIKATARPEKADLRAGEPFNLILALDMPKNCTISNVGFVPSQTAGLSSAGAAGNLSDGRSADTNNVVRRIAVPIRYDAPFRGRVTFQVTGTYECRIQSGSRGRVFSQTFSSDFRSETPPIWMEVKPLPTENQPADFSGAVGNSFKLSQKADRYMVETNDVVTVVGTLEFNGYVPPDMFPDALDRSDGRVVFRRYFVADGRPATEEVSFSYYDVDAREYRRISSRGMPLRYAAEKEDEPATVVVNDGIGAGEHGGRLLRLRFAPRESAREVAVSESSSANLSVTETFGDWVRVDDGRHAGWVRKEDLE